MCFQNQQVWKTYINTITFFESCPHHWCWHQSLRLPTGVGSVMNVPQGHLTAWFLWMLSTMFTYSPDGASKSGNYLHKWQQLLWQWCFVHGWHLSLRWYQIMTIYLSAIQLSLMRWWRNWEKSILEEDMNTWIYNTTLLSLCSGWTQ